MRILKLLSSVLIVCILSGCAYGNVENSGKEDENSSCSDFVLYSMDHAFYYSFDVAGLPKLDRIELTNLNCTFLGSCLKETDSYWYSVTSESVVDQRYIVQIDKKSLQYKLSNMIESGGFASTGTYHDAFLHDISSYDVYQLCEYNSELTRSFEKSFLHDEGMKIVLDICEYEDKVLVLMGDEQRNQWIQVLDSELNETDVYPKPDSFGTILRMVTSGKYVYIAETNTRSEDKSEIIPCYRILRFDPESGEFEDPSIVFENGYPYVMHYVENTDSLLIEHECWSLVDDVWTIHELDTGKEFVFKSSDFGYYYPEMNANLLAAYGNDGFYYFFMEGILYRVKMEDGIIEYWDLSSQTGKAVHTMIFAEKES